MRSRFLDNRHFPKGRKEFIDILERNKLDEATRSRKGPRLREKKKEIRVREFEKVTKSAWGMPWLSEAMKDVISCDKLRGGANNL